MPCNSIFCDSLMICLLHIALPNITGFSLPCKGLLEDFLRKIEHTFFEQQNDRRAAEAEQTFSSPR